MQIRELSIPDSYEITPKQLRMSAVCFLSGIASASSRL
jgi:hypothetical protein